MALSGAEMALFSLLLIQELDFMRVGKTHMTTMSWVLGGWIGLSWLVNGLAGTWVLG